MQNSNPNTYMQNQTGAGHRHWRYEDEIKQEIGPDGCQAGICIWIDHIRRWFWPEALVVLDDSLSWSSNHTDHDAVLCWCDNETVLTHRLPFSTSTLSQRCRGRGRTQRRKFLDASLLSPWSFSCFWCSQVGVRVLRDRCKSWLEFNFSWGPGHCRISRYLTGSGDCKILNDCIIVTNTGKNILWSMLFSSMMPSVRLY